MWDVACVQSQGPGHMSADTNSTAAADTTSTGGQSGHTDGHNMILGLGQRPPVRRDLFVDREERDYRASREQDERHRRRGGDGDLGGGRGGKVYHGAYWNIPSIQSASSSASSIMQQQHQQQQQQQI